MDHCPKCDTLLEPGSTACPSCHHALEERAQTARKPARRAPVEEEVVPDASLGPACREHGFPIAGQCSKCGRDVCMRCTPDLNTARSPRCARCWPRRAAPDMRGGAAADA